MPLFDPQPTIASQVAARNLAGFEKTNTDSTLSWTNGTRTVTIVPTGVSYNVWTNNQVWTITDTRSIAISNVVGQHFVTFDATGALTESTTPWDITSDQAAPVAIVYWDGTNGACGDERHSAQRDRWNHRELHNTRGTAYGNGLAGTFTNTTLSVTAGVVYDEELRLDLPSTYTNCRVFYRKPGATEMTFEDLTTPYKANTGVLQYDNGGTLTNITTSNYVTNWIYATDDIDRPIYVVVSQAQYTSATNARNAAAPTIPNITTREWKLIWRVIYRNVAGTATYIEAADYRTVSTLPGAVVTSLPAASVTFTPITGINSGNVQSAFAEVAPLTSGIADGATAVGVTFNTAVEYVTAGAKLLSLQNNLVEKAYFDYKGALHILATSTDTLSNVSLHLKAAIPILSFEGTAGTGRTFAITNNYGGANLMQFTYSTSVGTAATNVAMTINDSGQIGMGAVPTGARLYIAGDTHTVMEIDGTTSGRVRLSATTATAGTRNFEFQSNSGTFRLSSLNDSWGLYTTQYILNAGPDGSIGFNTATINIAGYNFVSPMANSGSAIGMIVNTASAYTTTAKLLSVQNNSVEKFYVDNTGSIWATNHVVSGSSGNIYSGAGGFFANAAVAAQIRGSIADAPNAVAVSIDNSNALSTNTTRLLSIRNNTVEKTWFGPTGSAFFTAGEVNSDLYQSVTAAAVTLSGQVADGATAVGAIIKNSTVLSTTGAKIASFRNATVEKAYVDKDGIGSFASITQGGQPAADQAGVFYVRRYGAVGDGATDDLPAFQAAVAAAYAWAQQYGTGAPTGSDTVPGAKVVTGSGRFRLVGNLDLTVGDPLGGGPTYYGMGRITLEGMGRTNTQLIFDNGTTVDGLSVGGYTTVSDMTIRGAARTIVKSIVNAGTLNAGRSAERLNLKRVFITGTPDTANGYVSLELPGAFWCTLDTVYAPYGARFNGSGNCFGVNIINCQIANYANNSVASLTLHGTGFNILGGIIYSVDPSTTPAILLEEGSMVVENVDFAYTSVNSTTGYDIVIGGGSTFGATQANIFGCNLPVRNHTVGVSGNIYVRSNVTGGEIGNNIYLGTPSIDIEAGAAGMSFTDAALPISAIDYDNSAAIETYPGRIAIQDYDLSSNVWFPGGQSILWDDSTGRLKVTTARAEGDISGDFVVDTLNTRTAGSGLLSVRNAGSNLFDVNYSGITKAYAYSGYDAPVILTDVVDSSGSPTSAASIIKSEYTLTEQDSKLTVFRNNTNDVAFVSAGGGGSFTLGIPPTFGATLITNAVDSDFSGTPNWTGTGWALSSGTWAHSSPSGVQPTTLALTYLNSAPVPGVYYRVTATIATSTAGVIAVKFGNSIPYSGQGYFYTAQDPKLGTLSTLPVGTTICTAIVLPVDNVGSLVIDPNSAWTGSIDDIVVEQITSSYGIGPELIISQVDRDFSGTPNWTGTGWSLSSNVWAHTAGANATTLSAGNFDGTIYTSEPYQITATIVTTTAGTLTPQFAGTNAPAVGQIVGTLTGYTAVVMSVNQTGLVFTPDANWVGSIDNISVRRIITAAPSMTAKTGGGFNINGAEVRSSTQNNVAIGWGSMVAAPVGDTNVAVGAKSMQYLSIGAANTAVGHVAMTKATTARFNTALGSTALTSTTVGQANTAIGYQALATASYANNNTALGSYALVVASTGNNNIGIGYMAGYGTNGTNALSTGSNNTYIGYQTVGSASSNTNELVLGYQAVGLGSNTTVIGNSSTTSAKIFGTLTNTISDDTTTNSEYFPAFYNASTGAALLKISSTKFTYNPSTGVATAVDFVQTSDARLKTGIETIPNALAKVLALRGVEFSRLDDPERRRIGVVAQEVNEVLPEVVVTGQDGTMAVSYQAMVGILIEAMKTQQEEIKALQAALKEIN